MKKFMISLMALVSLSAMAQTRIAKFDSNQDGKVDFAELTYSCEVSKNLFNKADKNGDELLSEAEMRTAKEYLFSKCKKVVQA